ncbi:MAG: 6-phosphofructokinase [Candidatus Fermentithermobacillus carboniphilus]|uniref:ATP-dependent 6-phosphofructokinase n=1 Tax=Candidatus Fermentithermobacillus carboniphilus TaxID=3085328 RepID=A0AAT9LD10_9FIRM|nr:MAG: 6-phosphofructokinase [Candidatus Fermentithermobacillus carboniphilus]
MKLKIGVLTSGGDAPGMNAAIRAVVRRAISLGLEVYGIRRGYDGLLDGDMYPMNVSSVADIIHRGGTILHTARSERFMQPEGQDLAAARIRGAGLYGVIVIGGEGSFRGMVELNRRGVRAVGVPGTIDNDIPYTDYSIGFDTAVNTGVEAVNRLRDTATSHERIFVVETMGRHSGQLALAVGVAGGAESILIPEVPLEIEEICSRLRRGLERGKKHSIIVVAEGAGKGFDVARQIEQCMGTEIRVTVLGHVQRGGTPTAFDRLLASRLGAKAVDVLYEGGSGLMIGIRGTELVTTPMEKVLEGKKEIDMELYRLAEDLAR